MRERTKFPKKVIERLPNLKLLTTTGMKNASFDMPATKAANVTVSGTSGYGDSTTEHTWALILALARNIPRDHANVASGNPVWQVGSLPVGLFGKTLGLVGLGRLGQSTAKIAHVFGMNIIAWSPNLTAERVAKVGTHVKFCPDLNTLMEQSDFVSIHMVLSPTTRDLITREALSKMKPTGLLINTSRGPIINEVALIDSLQSKKIKGAALDVYDQEPLPLDHPLRKLDNVVLSPHMGYVEEQNYKVFYTQTVENVIAFLDGSPKKVVQ